MAADGCEVLNNPGLFGTLVLWLKADDGPEADPSGGRIRVWHDRSGRNNDLSQGAPATQPTRRPADIAGHPTVVFDGLDDVLINTSPSGSFAGGISMLAVVKPTATPADAVIFAADVPGCDTTWFGVMSGMSMTDVYVAFSGGYHGRVIGTGGVLQGVPQVLAAAVQADGNLTLWRNGTTVTNGRLSGCTGRDTVSKLAIGADTGSPPGHFSPMALGEVLVYATRLTPDNVRALDGYLRARWGIP